MATACTHIKDHDKNPKPRTKGCEECLKTGDTWVHLRMCWNADTWAVATHRRTATLAPHFHETQHPLIRSAERGEDWRWCYIDGTYL